MILLIGTLFLLEHFCFGKCTTHAMFIKHANASSHGQVLEQKQKENAILLNYKNVLIDLNLDSFAECTVFTKRCFVKKKIYKLI